MSPQSVVYPQFMHRSVLHSQASWLALCV